MRYNHACHIQSLVVTSTEMGSTEVMKPVVNKDNANNARREEFQVNEVIPHQGWQAALLGNLEQLWPSS